MKNEIKILTTIFLVLFIVGIGYAQNQPFYDASTGNGNGFRFWNGNNSFKISMGTGTAYQFGAVSDYSIKSTMSNNPARGWTWGVLGVKPVASINTLGNLTMQGWVKSNAKKYRFGTNEYLYSNNGSLVWRGEHSTTVKLELRDKENTRYGTVHGSGNGTYFGLLDGDGNWSYIAKKDSYTDLKINNASILAMWANGKVRIGNVSVTSNDYKLFVEKGILTENVKVAVKSTSEWSDYVFNEDYKLMPLSDLGQYLKKEKHLPNVPSAEEMVENGLDVAKSDALLLEKIEEAHLYILELHTQMEKMNAQIAELQKQEKTEK